MVAPIVIEFQNLVESCGSLGDGKVVSLTTNSSTSTPRAFAAPNASGVAVMRTQSHIKQYAKSIAKVMCKA